MGNAGALKPLVESSRGGTKGQSRGKEAAISADIPDPFQPPGWAQRNRSQQCTFGSREEISLYLFIIYAQYS